MASTMIQVYIKQVLESFFHTHHSVRTETLSVVCIILNQGLVHPVHVSISRGGANDGLVFLLVSIYIYIYFLISEMYILFSFLFLT